MANVPLDPIPTRHSLLERLKDWADQTSWQDFFDTYWRLLYNVALKAGLTAAEAEEVVQETVIAVARKIAEFKADPAHGSFSAWLMRLTRWRIADEFRNRRPAAAANLVLPHFARAPEETNSTGPVHRVPDPAGDRLEAVWADEWEKNLRAAALERVKRLVSPRQYQMFDLHVLQNLSAQDAARTLRVTAASVYMASSRISRLVKIAATKLRREME
jgi:RNA polymerase sigma factor (sigma-70 family)